MWKTTRDYKELRYTRFSHFFWCVTICVTKKEKGMEPSRIPTATPRAKMGGVTVKAPLEVNPIFVKGTLVTSGFSNYTYMS